MQTNKIYFSNCMEGLAEVADNSVTLILVDLPYGQTAKNKWDKVLPMEDYIKYKGKTYEKKEFVVHFHQEFGSATKAKTYWEENKKPGLWTHYKRILKPNGAVILFGNGMFTADLMKSNPSWWRYNLVWEKTTPTGFLNANRMPLRSHEDICVFYNKQPTYNPQKTSGHTPVHSYTKHTSDGTNYGDTKLGISGGGSTERFPRSVWKFATDKQKENYHPTQKPLELVKTLILTYSNPGDLVLDHCVGSGTTAIAAIETGREFLGFENDGEVYKKCKERLNRWYGSKAVSFLVSK